MTLQTQAAPQSLVGGQEPATGSQHTPSPSSELVFLTTDEVASIIRTDRNYVSRQCANGNLRAKKVGKEWRVHRDDLDAFMRGGKAPPARSRSSSRVTTSRKAR